MLPLCNIYLCSHFFRKNFKHEVDYLEENIEGKLLKSFVSLVHFMSDNAAVTKLMSGQSWRNNENNNFFIFQAFLVMTYLVIKSSPGKRDLISERCKPSSWFDFVYRNSKTLRTTSSPIEKK